ncbi:MAG: hypothetical protein HQL06_16480 [Nitrospirae bacterium]|nr:hypothetical protein [Nitrospirota bacterium]
MNDRDLVKQMNELKSKIFYDILNMVGRVFVIVKYSDNVQVGNRGFTKEEKEDGLTLVFNSSMNFVWQDDILEAKLVFGTTSQRCVIPVQYIVAIYSPELQTQFVTTYKPLEDVVTPQVEETTEDVVQGVEDNIVKVDFTRKKKK